MAAWPLPPRMPEGIDTVFLSIDEIPANHLAAFLDGCDPAIIAIGTYESPTSLKTIIDLNAHGVISKPLRALGILTQFALARYRHGYEGRLNNKVRKLEETLKGRRLIEKAIRILAGTNGIDEDHAYRLVRDQATEKRITMVSVAEAIIAAHETMNGLGLAIASSKNE
jgi:AmiR/NasT family two-component response regulator